VSVGVEKLQRVLKGHWTEPTHVAGLAGYHTWVAMGRPDGWQVWTNGSWWSAEELNELLEEVDE